MTLMLETKINDKDLKEAIELRISEVFPAMNIANVFAGLPTTPWKILREFTPLQLFDEAKERNMPLETFKGAVTDNPIMDSPVYKSYIKMKNGWTNFKK